MSRVFRPQSAASERRKLLQSLALAVAVVKEGDISSGECRDLLAFSAQVMCDIADSVKATVSAWEKRGYWVKADRFMSDWTWVDIILAHVEENLRCAEDQPEAAILLELDRHLADITPPARLRKEKPWIGAWSRGQNHCAPAEG